MKALKRIQLNDVKVLTSVEMKSLKGGSVYCHCNGDSGYGRPAPGCGNCPDLCGSAGVQNCNYIA